MAKEPQPAPATPLFGKGPDERRIQMILDRAVAKRIKAATRGSKTKLVRLPAGGGRKAQKSALGTALAKALSLRGKDSKGKPSIRMSAPDTGGRSFHFAYYSVTKGEAFRAAPKSKGVGSTKGMGAAAAHLAYIERESAVERQVERDVDLGAAFGPELGAGIGLERGTRREGASLTKEQAQAILDMPRKRGRQSLEAVAAREHARRVIEADGFERGLDGPGRAGAAQTYIENPAKMRNGEIILSSFGNIGQTHEERLRFWEELEEHERMPNARIQNRIICELPHQSTPEARQEILAKFVAPFEEKGIPYHVAVHAPGRDNDSRNYHAHVVFSERPAEKLRHPETGDMVWDFTIVQAYKTKSRNTKYGHPQRKNRDTDLRKRSAIRDMRKRFAKSVTEVMKGVDPSVKFDARSYKDMGLDVDPMRTVNRVLHDRMRDGKLVIQDAQWTKRMVEAEIRAAAQRRDPDVSRLFETTRAMEAIRAAYPNVKAMNGHLAPRSKLTTIGLFTKATFNRVVNQRIALEHERLRERLVAKAEMAVCDKVIAASLPIDLKGPNRKEVRTPEDIEALAILHEAAKEEREAIRLKMQTADARVANLIAQNKAAWKSTAQAPMFDPYKPTTRDDAPRSPAGGARTRTDAALRRPDVAKPTVAPVPEKPDPVTGKVMFEPEYVVAERLRAAKADAGATAKAKRSAMPGAAQAGGGRPMHAALEREAALAAARTAPGPGAARAPTMPEALAAEAAARSARETGAAKTADSTKTAGAARPAGPARPRTVIDPLAPMKFTGKAAEINKMVASMYDPTLRGQEVADWVDAFWKEYGGKPVRPGATVTEVQPNDRLDPAVASPTDAVPARTPRTPENMGFTIGPQDVPAATPNGRVAMTPIATMTAPAAIVTPATEVAPTAASTPTVAPTAPAARRGVPDWSDMDATAPTPAPTPPPTRTSTVADLPPTPIAPSRPTVTSERTPVDSPAGNRAPPTREPAQATARVSEAPARRTPIARLVEEGTIDADLKTPATQANRPGATIADALRRTRKTPVVAAGPQERSPEPRPVADLAARISAPDRETVEPEHAATPPSSATVTAEPLDEPMLEAKKKKDRRRAVIIRKPGGKTR